jgi:hypothetical protein
MALYKEKARDPKIAGLRHEGLFKDHLSGGQSIKGEINGSKPTILNAIYLHLIRPCLLRRVPNTAINIFCFSKIP